MLTKGELADSEPVERIPVLPVEQHGRLDALGERETLETDPIVPLPLIENPGGPFRGGATRLASGSDAPSSKICPHSSKVDSPVKVRHASWIWPL
jgi:hypothetical protein